MNECMTATTLHNASTTKNRHHKEGIPIVIAIVTTTVGARSRPVRLVLTLLRLHLLVVVVLLDRLIATTITTATL